MKLNLKHSVFIVDDDADDRESIRDAFLENNHDQDFIFMRTGDQLIDHLQTAPRKPNPVVILLDLNMPGKDGKEVLKEIKASEALKPIPVIIMTTSSSDRDRLLSYELGANCFVTKPDSYKELMLVTDSIARLWFSEAS
ncbi:MAG: response regulator [Sphingobacteriales bacterium]|nr:MAG: response regulator [Sphingobacteriales bacterium]